MTKVANFTERWISYRLNIFGVRVWRTAVNLSQKVVTIDGRQSVRKGLCPVHIPQNVEELKDAATDSLRLTAYQYATSQTESDLIEVLSQRKDFEAALRDHVDLFAPMISFTLRIGGSDGTWSQVPSMSSYVPKHITHHLPLTLSR